ncbi:uncharacterized protein PV07_03325 [Cladophialophora immunda]|uniref:propanoyl-CoA C-acyltransferase n=1 Tax=Cladophialophora immunda TaxID=569365 RepID=A0A0D2CNV4_9EURO|nr:uncharacterized protein PV07_03325 [Cladophialophora immunda]KIW31725.1 hypothetical protein PV07_03325 [Cladophialophora immunda]OQV01360.1 Thiolase, domain-containing protein [Cladophialophora immunda]
MPPQQKSPVYVLGVGMTKFVKPRGKIDYNELGYEAGIKAMLDAHITYDDVDQGVACYCYGDSTSGQRVFYQFGMTAIPIHNTNNNCATASTGLVLARNTIAYGGADCVLVVGFEKMMPGSLSSHWQDRTDPIEKTIDMKHKLRAATKAPMAAQLYATAAEEYMNKYGAEPDDFAEIARINHEHSQRNPYSQFRDVYTRDQILQSPRVDGVLTKLQCCPTSDGGAAAVLVSQAFLDARPELKSQAILIAGQSMLTDPANTFDGSALNLIGHRLSARCAQTALQEANTRIEQIKLVELHDCFSVAEMIWIDALGLSEPGKAHEFVRQGKNTYGGQVVINPSGGLISKGHPLGATGLAQCAELVWQLRGWANNRLVESISVALAHNLGMGGAGVVTVYKRADGKLNRRVENAEVAKITGLGYNPAVEARGFTKAQAELVRSRSNSSHWALGDTQSKVEARF